MFNKIVNKCLKFVDKCLKSCGKLKVLNKIILKSVEKNCGK